MDAIKSSLSALALLCFCLVSWAAAENLTFQTLDGDTQQVNPDEIWRIVSFLTGLPSGGLLFGPMARDLGGTGPKVETCVWGGQRGGRPSLFLPKCGEQSS